ncbi:MAG: 3-phosphoserine/phosphohydroxythreonine transaminase [Crocinitomicaceae bacterium]|nr:3-phosphoserine/phosphohydroxythreonine transaminase [Crocinitomicaceae bacterium]MDG1736029.1 3-phosphoserine/phosphohydroxythreonine transaminase [Crocinitomicaceae bacterium]
MKYNFGAGPCILPQTVFQEASEAVKDFNGLSILEVSHRHKDFVAVMDEAIELVKKALNVPAGYSVIFLQGGASLGFSISALNMMRSSKKAAYINTGTWSKKAMTEAKKVGFDVLEVASSADTNFNYIPKNISLEGSADYLHFTSNNTIFGTQFKDMPSTALPLVCDMSSDIFSRTINVSDFDLIYAGAQKNMGPAGTTLYIVKDEILGKSTSEFMPTYLDLKTHAEKDSMFNTPPVFPVYASMLNLRDLMKNGGVKGAQERNEAKAALLYNEIDSNPLFKGTVAKEDRSNMNVTFLMNDDSRTDEFNTLWQENNLVGLKGHRSVGGYRASMYNALPLESVQVLVDVMRHFSNKG